MLEVLGDKMRERQFMNYLMTLHEYCKFSVSDLLNGAILFEKYLRETKIELYPPVQRALILTAILIANIMNEDCPKQESELL